MKHIKDEVKLNSGNETFNMFHFLNLILKDEYKLNI